MIKISLAAVPYFWTQEAYRSFYRSIACTEVDIVYLGETVCSKRRSMKLQDWLDIAEMLTVAGKQVVLSTLTLIEAESELRYLSNIASQQAFLIEANDMAAVQLAHDAGNNFVAGCAINIYNNRSLEILHNLGMMRWCVPVEIGRHDLAAVISLAKSLEVEIEYQVFGRIPLAYSARCFTARHHQLPKDNCQYQCLDYEQGILVQTQEKESFAQINGIQTQSSRVQNLLNWWQQLGTAGIDILRVVPVSAVDTINVVEQLGSMIHAQEKTFFNEYALFADYEYCNGYWFQHEGMKYLTEDSQDC